MEQNKEDRVNAALWESMGPCRVFHRADSLYPEAIEGTGAWRFSQNAPCSEAEEAAAWKGTYPGNRLVFFRTADGLTREPFGPEEGVFLERPAWDPEAGRAGILRYDFTEQTLQAWTYDPETEEKQKLTEMPLSEVGDLVNVRLLPSPFVLVRHEIHHDRTVFLWPERGQLQLLSNETTEYKKRDRLLTGRWVEDPDYREEVRIRAYPSGEVLETLPGMTRRAEDGTLWILTE